MGKIEGEKDSSIKPHYIVGCDIASPPTKDYSVLILMEVGDWGKTRVVDSHAFTPEFTNHVDENLRKKLIDEVLERWTKKYGDVKILK